MRQVKYVGHIWGNSKSLPDPAKKPDVASWKHEDMKTQKPLKAFLGLSNRCSIYIHKYAEYAAPLMGARTCKYQYERTRPNKKGTLDGNGKPVKRNKAKLLPKEMKVTCNARMI